MMRNYIAVLLLLISYSSVQAEPQQFSSGDQQVALIELFTSEGCSSCPPAEAWISNFKSDPRLWNELIPVAFHVDYWDSLGWKDTFSDPRHSKRQYQYQHEGAIRSVYTPGIVINGKEWLGLFRQQEPEFDNHPAGTLELRVADESVTAEYSPYEQHSADLSLNLAILAFGHRSEVTSGENSGRYLHQDFAVVGFKRVDSESGVWHTDLPPINHTAAKRYALAAWVSLTSSQTPLQAAGGWLQKESFIKDMP